MKASTKKILSVHIALIILFALNAFTLKSKNALFASLVLAVAATAVYFMLGFEKNRQRMREASIQNIIIFTGLLQIILYLSGLFIGFIKSSYDFSLESIFRNTIPQIFLIGTMEFLRYLINVKSKDSKKLIIFSFVSFSLIESFILLPSFNLAVAQDAVGFILTGLLPIFSKNLFLTYSSYKFGYETTMLYRAVMELPQYLIPIAPDIGEYLNAVIAFVFPIWLFYYSSRTIGTVDEKQHAEKINSRFSKAPGIIIAAFLVLLVALVSGLFPYYMIAVGSSSMEKEIYMGDAVIVKKLDEDDIGSLEVGDVLVYYKYEKVIVHRITEIAEEDGESLITTKGDMNENNDAWTVVASDIRGKVVMKVKLIGWPTIWVNQLITQGNKA